MNSFSYRYGNSKSWTCDSCCNSNSCKCYNDCCCSSQTPCCYNNCNSINCCNTCNNSTCDCSCNCNCNCNCSNNCCFPLNCSQTIASTPIPLTLSVPVPITSLSVNTSNLCNPSIKIDFTSTINFNAILAGATLTLATPFTVILALSRVSNNGSKIALTSFSYSYSTPLSTSISSSLPLNLNYIDCNLCHNCYTYVIDIISVTPLSLSAGTITSQSASIINSRLCAIVG